MIATLMTDAMLGFFVMAHSGMGVCRIFAALDALRSVHHVRGLSRATGHVAGSPRKQRCERAHWHTADDEREQGDQIQPGAVPSHSTYYNPAADLLVPATSGHVWIAAQWLSPEQSGSILA